MPTRHCTHPLPSFLNATFTDDQGRRRIRVFNQKYQSTDTFPRLFKSIDGTAIAMSLARTAAVQSDSLALPELRDNLQTAVEDLLTQYRAQCSASSSTGQLVLPENGKLLPLLLNALLKSPLLLLNEPGRRELAAIMPRGDLRAWAFQYVLRCSPSQFLDLLYPTLYKLDPADDAWGREDATGFLAKPRYLFLTAASLDLSGVYLLSGLYGWRLRRFVI